MFAMRYAILAIVVLTGCYSASSRVDSSDVEAADGVRSSGEEIFSSEGLTNVHPLSAKQPRTPIPPPKASQDEGLVALQDLGIVLRLVKFEQPINGRRDLFFSEAEITNRQYAAYLHDTAQQRDDTEIVQLEEKLNQVTTTVNEDGSTTFSSRGFDTSSASIGIHQPAMHWKGGTFPAEQGDYPVAFLTTPQASDFCQWLTARYGLKGSFRLPEEHEWLAAAYGATRKYPWGDDEREWTGKSSEPVLNRSDLRTPDDLYGMWGNVSELVLSASNGYGGKMQDFEEPMITQWLGTTYEDEKTGGKSTHPRQDYWGYTHSNQSRSDQRGFRVVFVTK
jgi:formylglycine-generating enzyme required for sulfatase activity